MNDQFKTISSPARNIRAILIAGGIASAAALYALTIAVVTFIFFEGIIILSLGLVLMLTARTRWILIFNGSQLTITNTGNGNTFGFSKLTRDDFVFKQSNGQKAKNRGDLRIKGSSAVMNDLADFEELKAYIETNFH